MKKLNLITLSLMMSISGFAQWGQVNNGIANLSFGAKLLGSSETYIFSGTLADAKMYRSNDNGSNWNEIPTPVTGNLPECGFFFDGKYFAGLNSSQECIFFSTDDGSSWSGVSGGPQTTVVRGFFSFSGHIFAYTSSGGIYKSSEGSDWGQANNGLGNFNVIWMESVNSKLLAATIGGGVYASTDNGATWFPSNGGIAGSDLNATMIWRMGTSLYYLEQGGVFYASSDEGVNWSVTAKPAVMGLAANEIYRKGNNLYLESRHFAGGLRDSVYLSTNEGETWTNITENLSATDLNASGITEFNGFTFIAYNLISPGMGIYRRGLITGTDEKVASINVQVFPNPFSEKVFVSIASDHSIKQINLFDSQGKRVMTEDNTRLVNTSTLPDGIYIVQVVLSDNTTLQQKLVKESAIR